MIESIIEGVIYVVANSINVIFHVVSRRFRAAKRKEWAVTSMSKYWEPGAGGICLVSLAIVMLWLWFGRSPIG